MISRAALLACLCATPATARDIILAQPIDCILGDTCFIQQYVDADPSPAAADFTCNGLSYDGHKGTDFALPSLVAMQVGVDILAAAPGRIRAIRDGIPNGTNPENRECGNGVVIDHGGAWETQYCHMTPGSIAVIEGQRVGTGTILGQVGLSGNTQFPHLHFALRHNDQVMDPFNRDNFVTCDIPDDDQNWQKEITYQPGGIINVGMATGIPEFTTIKAGEAHLETTGPDAPALVIWAYLFGAREGDQVRLTLKGPNGQILLSDDIDLTKNQAQIFRAIGKRLPDGGWPIGTYSGESILIRNGVFIGPAQISHIRISQ